MGKWMSYRGKLLLAFGLLIGLVLSLAGVSIWGNQQTLFHFERAGLAHQVNEAYLRLSSRTYQLFKKLTEVQATGDESQRIGTGDLEQQLRSDIRLLRHLIATEVAFVEEHEREEEKAELFLLSRIELEIDRVLTQFAEVQKLKDAGRYDEANAKLNTVLDVAIEGRFNVLINEAVQSEAEEVVEADAEARSVMRRVGFLVQVLAGLGVVLSLFCVVMLVRGLRRPLIQLLVGTRALQEGNLQHRINLTTDDEFGEFAESFNHMAEELETNKRDLESAKSDLEEAVAWRTAELRTANTALERVDETRRRFFADISHELRTPLTIIRGEAEIGLRGPDKAVEDYKSSLNRVLEQAKHTGRLVDDLLFVARQDAGETRMVRQAVSLQEIVASVCGDAEVLAEKRGVNISEERDIEEAVVSGDPGRLRQLFLILVDNAIRYSEAHGDVSVYMGQAHNGVMVRVSDNGIGIAPDELDQIFERFYRGDNASVHHSDGTGLGLPVAKAIADAHGGELVIESNLGEGTTATVTLPTVRRIRAVA